MVRTNLEPYRRKRDFSATPEPPALFSRALANGARAPAKKGRGPGGRFVVHEHHASRLHFDLRLEMGGVLKSYAVPKGPSLDPKDRRLAVNTEDHPVKYLTFEGSIGDGQYGAGQMVIWDAGTYSVPPGEDPLDQWEKGKLHLNFRGEKMRGGFMLIRGSRDDRQWLLFKKRDDEAKEDWQPSLILPYGGRTEAEIDWPAGAKVSPLPGFIEPMLATLADGPFDDPQWIFETKWDGWRALLRKDDSGIRLISRSGKSLDAMFPELINLGKEIRADACMLDGEIVALDNQGVPRFQLLQNRLKGKALRNGEGRIVYFAFDLLHCEGRDLMPCGLIDRKAVLRKVLPPAAKGKYPGAIRVSDHFEGRGVRVFEEAVRLGFEGMMAKLKHGPYRKGRSADWLKVKAKLRQEVVIAGYTEPRGSRALFGSLVAGLYQGKEFKFAGHVGGGFNARLLKVVHGFMKSLETRTSPFVMPPKTNEKVHWLEPKLVAEVEFMEWTEDGRMRQPVFKGLRPDKDPKECVRESAQPEEKLRIEAEAASTTSTTSKGTDAGTPVITNPQKVFWPDEGFTKGDLIAYYRTVAPYILPHLKDRPLILKRYPNGIGAPPFYQHDVKSAPAFVATVPVREDGGAIVNYALCQNAETLTWLANLAVIPQNPWLSRSPKLNQPDWIVFDLDPQEVAFPEVCGMALFMKELLEGLGLKVFVKTSGSRGIHIYVPLKPGYDFAQGLAFSQLVGALAVKEKPREFTVVRSLKVRKRDVIYLDCMQNSEGKSVASVYSVRERPGANVSAPLEWSELKRKLRMEDFNIRTMPKRLERKGDLFKDVLKIKNGLEGALKKLEKRL
ncbi:MAG: DNA ligase D [Fibrobacterota bacterium]|nr:DNA ligase D [Fibrobacterota bacterium]